MNRILYITPGPHRRIYLGMRHIHHGFEGLVLVVVGLVLIAHDWHDRPFWPERFFIPGN